MQALENEPIVAFTLAHYPAADFQRYALFTV